MFPDDPFHDHQTQSGSRAFCGEIRFKYPRKILFPDPVPAVGYGQGNIFIVCGTADFQTSSCGHCLKCVADKIVKCLFQLPVIPFHHRHIFRPDQLHIDLPFCDLMAHKVQRFQHKFFQIKHLKLHFTGTQCVQKLGDDRIQPLHFMPGFLQFLSRSRRIKILPCQKPLKILQMQIKTVQGIADLVSDSGSQHGNKAAALGFRIGMSFIHRCRNIGKDHHKTVFGSGIMRPGKRFCIDLHHPPPGIKDLQILTQHFCLRRKHGIPICALEQFIHGEMGEIIGDPQHGFCSGIVIKDPAHFVDHDNSLLNGIEHRFHESLFPGKVLHHGMHTSGIKSFQFRNDPSEPVYSHIVTTSILAISASFLHTIHPFYQISSIFLQKK